MSRETVGVYLSSLVFKAEPRGERRANTTGTGQREATRTGPNGKRRGPPRFSVFERKSAAAARDKPVQPSAMTRKKICSICRKDVRQPCWVCVDCYYQSKWNRRLSVVRAFSDILTIGVGSLICDECEERKLLRCVGCQTLYKQPYWYYGCSEGSSGTRVIC